MVCQNYIVSAYAVLHIFVDISLAYEYCGDGKFCPDYGTSIGYCCGELFDDLCCFYTDFWRLWYFWFGIVIFFLLITACIGVYRRQRSTQFQPASQIQVARVTTTSVPDATEVPLLSDQPPSYQQIQRQGISSQYQQYAKHEAEAKPTDPILPQHTQPPAYGSRNNQ